MSIDQLIEKIHQRLAQSPLVQQDTGIRRQFRIRQIVDHVVQEAGVELSEQEYRTLVKLVGNNTR